MRIEPGIIIAGRYRAESLLGRGGMGEVWRCLDEERGVAVAVKAVRPERVDGIAGRLFRTEILAVARLSHPGIVPIYDLVRADDGTALLVMALCPGEPLSAFVKRTPPWRFVRAVLGRALDALAYAHARGVLHLDVKPDNVLVHGGEADPRVILLDFGVARVAQGGRAVAEEHFNVLGTLEYMAPEQCTGSPERFGPWTDLFALGAVAFELCTGKRPFRDDPSPATLLQRVTRPAPRLPPRDDVPPGFADLCARLLEPEPSARPLSAAEVRAALDAIEPKDDRASGACEDDEAGAASGVYGLFGMREAPLVARAEERRVLADVLARVRAHRRPEIVVLEGRAGAGKSRIARDVVERAVQRDDCLALATSWSPDGPSGEGSRSLVENLFEARGAHPEDVAERVRLLVARVPGDHERFLRDVGLLLFPPKGAAPDAGLPLRVALDAILRAAALRPLVLWLDDVQWGRGEAAALVRALLAHEPPIPALVLATLRTEEIPDARVYEALVAEPSVHRISVEPLQTSATRALVRSLLDVDDELCELFASRAEGNPLFATQLVRQLVASEAVERRDGRYRLARAFDLATVPADIGAVWGRRIAAVGAEPMHLAALALVRAEVVLEVAHALGDALGPGFEASLSRALSSGLLEQRRGAYVWVHQLLRDYLVGLVRGDDVHRLHGLAADVLARLVGREDVQEERARHLALAGRAREACEALLEAGLWSARRADPEPRRARFEQLVTWSRDASFVDLEARALAELAAHHADVGERDLANERIAEADALVADLAGASPELERQAGWVALRRASVARLQGRREEGATATATALALGRASGETGVVAMSLQQFGLELVRAGRFPEARTALLEAAELYRGAGDGPGEAQVLRMLAGTETGAEAVATVERAIALARSAGATRIELIARQVWVGALWAAGRRADARRQSAILAEEAARRSLRQMVALTELESAAWAAIEGDAAAARRHLATAEHWGVREGAGPERAIAAGVDALLAAIAGDDAAVADALSRAYEAFPGLSEASYLELLQQVAERSPDAFAPFSDRFGISPEH